jgi:hypothetical protein
MGEWSVYNFGRYPRRDGSGRAPLSFIRLFNQENDAALLACGDFDLVARFADQVRDVDHRQRIGAVHFQEITRRDRL